ncbi:hypothetical protein [Microbacterium sp.]|uniref:hypothetical protein n=1 Tax=Microbacterium sp. TaxID=51671 RepID=UPI002E327521|nr:hypothetical protein [Microbacterium sp.]HEX5729645.1 hypothetical protein [Microbacterium sp.]
MRRVLTFLAGATLVAGILAGCATPDSEISLDVSAQMQDSVVSIAESAAAGDLASATALLDELQKQLDDAVANGDVSAKRAAAIQNAIDVVRADLQAPPAAPVESPPAESTEPAQPTETPEPTESAPPTQPAEPTPSPEPVEPTEPAEPVEPTPAPEPTPPADGETDTGGDDSGEGGEDGG